MRRLVVDQFAIRSTEVRHLDQGVDAVVQQLFIKNVYAAGLQSFRKSIVPED